MKKIFLLTFKSSIKQPQFLFWSFLVPIMGIFAYRYFAPDTSHSENFIFGMIAISILFQAFLSNAFEILSQRKRGVINLLQVTPLPLSNYVLSVSSAWVLISVLCGMVNLLIGFGVLGIQITVVKMITMIPFFTISGMGYVFLAFALSSLCSSENQMSMVGNIAAWPLILCSTAFYSLEGIPVLNFISHLNPFQYLLNGLQIIMSNDFTTLFTSFGCLLLFFGLMFVLALCTFRYKR